MVLICLRFGNSAFCQKKIQKIQQINKCEFLNIALKVDSAINWLGLRNIKADTIDVFDWSNTFDGCNTISELGITYRFLAMKPGKRNVIQAAIMKHKGTSYEIMIVSGFNGNAVTCHFGVKGKQIILISCELGNT
ncbi:hypothetical protein CJD36_020860 [Flavipsychrobacter stenotrophus]|uniref:Uncharacterized protein n=1 Tax=Flavipsychrobacter stenotrophus TaxID=2077091 RepID=A0A2S7SQ52_9BACT|nr:hypothetical protein CJD36_020860 [Flavipsychrobacter stenotrophus]